MQCKHFRAACCHLQTGAACTSSNRPIFFLIIFFIACSVINLIYLHLFYFRSDTQNLKWGSHKEQLPYISIAHCEKLAANTDMCYRSLYASRSLVSSSRLTSTETNSCYCLLARVIWRPFSVEHAEYKISPLVLKICTVYWLYRELFWSWNWGMDLITPYDTNLLKTDLYRLTFFPAISFLSCKSSVWMIYRFHFLLLRFVETFVANWFPERISKPVIC